MPIVRRSAGSRLVMGSLEECRGRTTAVVVPSLLGRPLQHPATPQSEAPSQGSGASAAVPPPEPSHSGQTATIRVQFITQ